MKEHSQLEHLKQEYLSMDIPKEGLERMKQSIDRAMQEKRRIRRRNRVRCIGGAAAALVIAIALPNINADIAYAMERIPVLGAFFKVVTIRDYQYEDEHNEADVKVPEVIVEGGREESGNPGQKELAQLEDSAQRINLDVDRVTQELITQFEEKAAEEGHMGLYINYETVTDNERWFTLRLIVVETQASGYEYYKYYTVDKQTGEVVSLAELFREGSGYLETISENIKEQMRERMAADEGQSYFLDEEINPEVNFNQIKEDQNFYFNEDGKLTIVFDEYEVAPGYMGPQEFVIEPEVMEGLLK